MSDLSGQYLGRYYLSERLGEGGMAVVYKAYDTRLERDVAIKIIRSGAFPLDAMGELLKRFEREAKSLAKLSHPNIVKVYDYGEHENQPFLVMEYLPGGTLKKKLGKAMPWQDAVRIILPVAHGIAYAHQRGVLHRDIKPANILVTDSGEPMLSDFGIAKLFEGDQTTALTGSGMAIGTPEYMAPEQWTGTTSPQSDLYSLGIVLYEMVAGRKPYVADTPAAILIKQVTEPLPGPRRFAVDLPEALEFVLIKALAREPGERHKDLNAFISALENLRINVPAVPASEQEQIEKTGKSPEQGTMAPATIQTSARDDGETIRAVDATESPIRENTKRKAIEQAKPEKIEGQASQIERIGTILSKFFASNLRSLLAKPRNKMLAISIAALFIPVAGFAFYNRLSTPPLFFSGISGEGVNVYSLKGETITKITQTVADTENWSPVSDSGGNLYFTSDRTGTAEIFGFNTNTGELWQVTDTPGQAQSWSPTIGFGANIYFTSDRTGKAEIFGFNSNTGELWQVTDTPGQAQSWSPAIGSGANLYFTSDRTGKAEIFGFNSNTGELWQVTDTPGQAQSWSPAIGSGANLYFTSDRTGKAEIFGFNSRTGELWQETDTLGQAESWSPVVRGRKIYFTSNRSGMTQIYRLASDETAVTDLESWTNKLNDQSAENSSTP